MGADVCVVVGLGNPGKEYTLTRHNMGFMVVQMLAKRLGVAFKEHKRQRAYAGKGAGAGVTMHLVMPTTYMNESGQAVRGYLDYHKLGVDALVVVTDDVALPFGQMRLRGEGSAGGHNGLKSVESHLGTREYVRLRMGIGGNGRNTLTGHVLGGFTVAERQRLEAFVERGADAVWRVCHEDIETVMNEVNTKYTPPSEGGQESK